MCVIPDVNSLPFVIGDSNDILATTVIDIGTDLAVASRLSTITASVAVQLEGFSLIMVAYTSVSGQNSLAIVSQLVSLSKCAWVPNDLFCSFVSQTLA